MKEIFFKFLRDKFMVYGKFELDDKKNIKLISDIPEEVFESAPVVVKKDSKKNLSHHLLNDNNNTNKNESDSKIFGSYDFFEIPYIIEKNIVLNRYFSSYTLIKFSLLNILAITFSKVGSIENIINKKKIIETIFEFCERTNFLVRQYIIIYLNIFQNLKEKFANDIKEYEDCITIMIKYLNKTEMIPKEDFEIEEEKEEGREWEGETKNPDADTPQAPSETPSGEENKKFDKFFEENGKFFSLNNGMFNKNVKSKYEETLKVIEVVFSGNYDDDNDLYISNSINKLYGKINFKDKKKPKNFIPKTPLDLYSNSHKLLEYYLGNYSLSIEIFDDLLINFLSLLYYFKIPIIGEKWIEKYKEKSKSQINSNNEKDELNKILKIIITILSKLFEVINSEKERLSKILTK